MTLNQDRPQLHNTLAIKQFNTRFQPGDSVLFLPRPEWDRIYTSARIEDGVAVVELAGRKGVYPISAIHASPVETTRVRAPQNDASLWQLVTAFVCGFAAATLVTLSIAPAGAVAPESIVIECEEPGEFAAVEEDVA